MQGRRWLIIPVDITAQIVGLALHLCQPFLIVNLDPAERERLAWHYFEAIESCLNTGYEAPGIVYNGPDPGVVRVVRDCAEGI